MRDLLAALDRTIARLSGDTAYSWGHMGMCNCGHLAQSITGLTQAEIHASALEREGDWEAQANRYSPSASRATTSDPNVLRRAGRTYRGGSR